MSSQKSDDDEPREYSSPACYLHEFEQSTPRVDAASRIIAASAATLYRAHMDPQALMQWLPPEGMKGHIEQFDARVGGSYRMVLTYQQPDAAGSGKTTENSDAVQGRFVALIPDRQIVQIVEFQSDDPQFAGEMTITWTFLPVPEGTQVTVRCEDVPPGIQPEDHQAGLASSLSNLADFCEP
ncbi:SRPBCC domain-containing protein [Steroidobacter sp.]|uniref:SRPBCC domain-containing protein n=1 Tax=Steroidobacter sp. TaxID=1978227 RepID=UPI001A452F13|nr:SRPBCC domain-containing protein [Steroidobacter sp.]MBL8270169.1 SRPBCC domain-containing protein [Steroidobacter sp.]